MKVQELKAGDTLVITYKEGENSVDAKAVSILAVDKEQDVAVGEFVYLGISKVLLIDDGVLSRLEANGRKFEIKRKIEAAS